MECVCTDGTSIPPLVIFKGEGGICEHWLPEDVPDDWFVSCSSKGWTSDAHGLEWMKQCFEPATRVKANGEMRLLIYDGHGSHASDTLIDYCMKNKIDIIMLPAHSSHVSQSLDVSCFAPLKRRLAFHLSNIFRTGITTLQKAEWFGCYIKARIEGLTCHNIKGGWRGTGIFPLNPAKLLQKLPESSMPTDTPKADIPETILESFENILIDDSPPDTERLQSAHRHLKHLCITKQPLNSPVRKYIPQLGAALERALAENIILESELKNCKKVLGERKTRMTGKRAGLKGEVLLTTHNVRLKMRVAAEATKVRKELTGKPRGRPRKNDPPQPIVRSEETEDGLDT
jgi:hypothetical protein